MVKLIITGHGKFSSGIMDGINFIMGAQKDIVKIEFDDTDLDAYSNKIEEIIKCSEKGAIIFTDIIGGTPFRISTILCTKYDNVCVITGANIPMIIESIIKRENMPLKELIVQIMDTGKNGIQTFDKNVILKKSSGSRSLS